MHILCFEGNQPSTMRHFASLFKTSLRIGLGTSFTLSTPDYNKVFVLREYKRYGDKTQASESCCYALNDGAICL